MSFEKFAFVARQDTNLESLGMALSPKGIMLHLKPEEMTSCRTMSFIPHLSALLRSACDFPTIIPYDNYSHYQLRDAYSLEKGSFMVGIYEKKPYFSLGVSLEPCTVEKDLFKRHKRTINN
jgi:hypothetical protein